MNGKLLVLYGLLAGVLVSLIPAPSSACWLCWRRHHYWQTRGYRYAGTSSAQSTTSATNNTSDNGDLVSVQPQRTSEPSRTSSVSPDTTVPGGDGVEESSRLLLIAVRKAIEVIDNPDDVTALLDVAIGLVGGQRDRAKLRALRDGVGALARPSPRHVTPSDDFEDRLQKLTDDQKEMRRDIDQLKRYHVESTPESLIDNELRQLIISNAKQIKELNDTIQALKGTIDKHHPPSG